MCHSGLPIATVSLADEAIGKLNHELQVANELIEDLKSAKRLHTSMSEDSIHELSTAASATSKLLKSGKTLTQVKSLPLSSSFEITLSDFSLMTISLYYV